MNKTVRLLFLTHFLTRLVFIGCAGIFANYSFSADAQWLIGLSHSVTVGNYCFVLPRFIVSPLFPLICGLLQVIFNVYWNSALIVVQLLLSALSGVVIYKIADILFKNKHIALIASLIYAFFPLTLLYVNTFSQENLFQNLFIFSFYYLLRFLDSGRLKAIGWSAVLFSLAFLTKSHILLFGLFIPVIIIHKFRITLKSLWAISLFTVICLIFVAPYGILNYHTHRTVVLSSNGGGFQFALGNSNYAYYELVAIPPAQSAFANQLKQFDFKNLHMPAMDSILKLPHAQKELLFYHEGLKWLQDNRMRAISLKLHDAFFFLLPGVSYRHYCFKIWLPLFIVSLPIYLFAYFALYQQLRKNWVMFAPVFYLCIAMLLFSVVWYVQNRFRTITIEPLYIVLSAWSIYTYINKRIVPMGLVNKIAKFYRIETIQ